MYKYKINQTDFKLHISFGLLQVQNYNHTMEISKMLDLVIMLVGKKI